MRVKAGHWQPVKNIAIMIHSLNTGGAERIAGLLSKRLSDEYNVYLFLEDSTDIIYDYGGKIIDLGYASPLYEDSVYRLKQELDIDVAISFLCPTNILNLRTKHKERIIISQRNFIDARSIAYRMQVEKYYNYADAVVACSYGILQNLIDHGVTENVFPVYNFIDKAKIYSLAAEKLPQNVNAFLNGSEFFLNVGRLHNQKNQLRLIRQFAYFHEQDMSGRKLLIIGSGEEETALKNLILELNLEYFVKIIPYEKNPFRYMEKANALILSSRYEGLPNILLEGMALSCPIIATDCVSGPRELLQGETDYRKSLAPIEICHRGIIVSNNPSEDTLESHHMAEAMVMICDCPELGTKFRCEDRLYMAAYDNDYLTKQWVDGIERESKSSTNLRTEDMNRLKCAKHIIIYGVGRVGRAWYMANCKKYRIDCFAVSRREAETCFMDVPICEISELTYLQDSALVVIGVGERLQGEIVEKLRYLGFSQFLFPY